MTKKLSNIYLIRHGFTPANNASYNDQRGMSEIAIDSYMPLEKHYGRRQAEELGKFLDTIKGKTLILVSPYNRTLETLEIALKYMHGDYRVMIKDELHEINSGIHYARTKDEVLELFPETGKSFYRLKNWFPNATHYIYGESEKDVEYRVYDISVYIEEMSTEYDNVFVFGHGTVNKWIYYWISDENVLDHNMKNCEVIKINGKKAETVFVPETVVPKGIWLILMNMFGEEEIKLNKSKCYTKKVDRLT